ncbi:MAG TPA: PilZ domain-containing protein [Polyangiaceae bacterium]|jgi:hypothetical protein
MGVPRLLRERQAVRLEFPDTDGMHADATVAEVNDDLLWLECDAAGDLPALRVGARVLVRCWDSFGAYCALTQLVALAPASARRFAVESCAPLEPSENRRYFRVHVRIPFVVSPLKVSDPRAAQSPFVATTIDVSPGGLKFDARIPYMVGDRLSLRLTYGGRPLDVEGRVVRTAGLPGEEERTVSVEFLNTEAEVQFQLVRLIFAEQQRTGGTG